MVIFFSLSEDKWLCHLLRWGTLSEGNVGEELVNQKVSIGHVKSEMAIR